MHCPLPILLACWFAACATPLLADEPGAFASEALREKVGLLPAGPPEYGPMGTAALIERNGGPLAEDAQRAFEHGAGGKWKTFRDDLLSFELPDNPLLRVVPIEPGDPIAIVGGAFGTADRRFQRAYRLVVGPRLPYLAIYVQETDRFDDGFCACGPIVHEQLVAIDGSLLQFSYLPEGAIKKVQVLGARHRAIVLEWTHTAIPQETFARIGRSLRLVERSPRSREEWMKIIDARNESDARLPWLEANMEAATVRALLGEPTKVEGATWTYVKEISHPDGTRWRSTVRVPFENGRFSRFGKDWSKHEELAAEHGSVGWAEQLFGRFRSSGIPGFPDEQPKTSPSAAPAREVADAFLRRSDERDGEHWARWCIVMANLFEAKLGDPRVVEKIEETFLDLRREQISAIKVLELAESQRRKDLFRRRLRLIMEKAEAGQRLPACGEVLPLLLALGSDEADTQALFRVAQRHANADIRAAAAAGARAALAKEAAARALITALEDESPIVRAAAAEHLLQAATPDHLPALRACFAKESDPTARDYLHFLIGELSNDAEPRGR